jgi:5'-nucleotidase
MTTHLLFVLATLSLLIAPAPLRGQEEAGKKPYRILITNDDGIQAPGIRALVNELRSLGELLVVAPDGNRSGSSMSITFRGLVRVGTYDLGNGIVGYGVNGTPSDAVAFGLLELSKDMPVDLVVSGINNGYNVGNDAHMSGTVGAARAGAIYGSVPAVAVSLIRGDGRYEFPAEFAARVIAQLKEKTLSPGVVLNINFPSGDREEIVGVAAASMGSSYFGANAFHKREDPFGRTYYWGTLGYKDDLTPDTDSTAFREKKITITPLRIEWTDRELLKELETWDLELK